MREFSHIKVDKELGIDADELDVEEISHDKEQSRWFR